MIMVVFIKPSFLYDNERQQYKEFGTGNNQTIFTLPTIAIILAIIIAMIAMIFKIKSAENKNNTDLNINYKFIPVPVYYQQPMVQVPFNQMTQQLSNQLQQMQNIIPQQISPITQAINVNQNGGKYMITPEMLLNQI